MWDSMTRFIVLHGTHDVTLARNVGFLSIGHGYYLEDGSEIDNLLCHNLGVSARALAEGVLQRAGAIRRTGPAARPRRRWRRATCRRSSTASARARRRKIALPQSSGPPNPPTLVHRADEHSCRRCAPARTRFMPVMFWTMNAANEFVGNAAVGVHGFGSCYWLLGSGVSGPSASTSPVRRPGELQHHDEGLPGAAAALPRQLVHHRDATGAAGVQAEMSPAAMPVERRSLHVQRLHGGPKPVPARYGRQQLKPASQLAGSTIGPAVVGNFQPIQPNTAGPMALLHQLRPDGAERLTRR